MRILVKWYFNELLGYLIMPFTSIPVTGNEKQIRMYFLILKSYILLLPTDKKMILSSNHMVLTKLYVGNVYNRL